MLKGHHLETILLALRDADSPRAVENPPGFQGPVGAILEAYHVATPG